MLKKTWQLIDDPAIYSVKYMETLCQHSSQQVYLYCIKKMSVCICMKYTSHSGNILYYQQIWAGIQAHPISAKHLRKYDRRANMFVLPLFSALNCDGRFCQNSEWGMASVKELSASNCRFVFRVGSENRDGGGGKEKHAGFFSPLSCHLGFVEGFSPSHFLSIEK